MRPMATLWKSIACAGMAAALVAPSVQAEPINESPSAGAMIADAVVARPLYFALSQAGAAVYTVTLPFTLLGGNADQAAETLVVTPLQGAFVRCLGCGKIESQVGNLSEHDDTKRIRHFVSLNNGMSFLKSGAGNDEAINYGLSIGTHFALNDASRFDVLFGVKNLGSVEDATNSGNLLSYQISSRFGRHLGPFDLMFKLGVHYWDTNDVALGSVAKSDFSYLYGVGVDLWASEHIRFSLDYTNYDLKENARIDSAELNLGLMF